MSYFFLTLIFLFGAGLGSFVAVIGSRYNTGLPWTKGRSICFSCNAQLKKGDLFPIFSFLFLKGRCRYCQSKIPIETFFVEILMGILAVLAFFKSGMSFENLSIFQSFNLLIILSIFSIILLISVYDLKHSIIPDSFLSVLFVFSFSYILIFNLSIFTFWSSAYPSFPSHLPHFQGHLAWVW